MTQSVQGPVEASRTRHLPDAASMCQTRIYGICLVKNEDDVIAHSLTFASRYCSRIFVLDNGSTDATWEIVRTLARKNNAIVPFQRTVEPFWNGLRALVYNSLRTELSERDWWLILDADEFLAEDPMPIVQAAAARGADTIHTWQIQFYFTDRDLEAWERGEDSRETPIFERRRHYMIDWQETRLFRNDPRRYWDAGISSASPPWLRRALRRRILNRHYQFRDPEQIAKRLRLRYGHQWFPHVPSADWRSTIRRSRDLNVWKDGQPWRFSPSGMLRFYRRSVYDRLGAAWRGGAVRRVQRLLTDSVRSRS